MSAQIHPTAEVEAGSSLGDGTRVWRNAHIRAGAQVGSDCVVGGGAYIDAGVIVGDGVKIQNHALIYAPATIGNGCFIGPGACLTNDVRPRAVTPDGDVKGDGDWSPVGVTVADGGSVGAMAVILAGVAIGEWAMVGAGATVVSNVPPHALSVGNPARQIGWVCRCGNRLDETLRCSCGRTYVQAGEGLRLE